MVTAEPSPDLPIKARKGIITAECMFALNSVKDLMVGIRDAFGGRSKTIQKELRRMRETVITELKQEALAVGANAVISVSLEYSQMTGKGDPFLFIAAVGTAVEISDNKGV
ncbi:hypothetical protein Tel_13065 [Candidatus Tenderia electrophaga]|uniref:Uncharacterized protein n=1 Tax=Candidatus Tenderia electrophaga TaxID=1748243 RepID=A0A0S2TI93_9GAMM|nr:hypothetical protein Tel_13065 [Candidatus Tenderia electrophaga]